MFVFLLFIFYCFELNLCLVFILGLIGVGGIGILFIFVI